MQKFGQKDFISMVTATNSVHIPKRWTKLWWKKHSAVTWYESERVYTKLFFSLRLATIKCKLQRYSLLCRHTVSPHVR